MGTDVAAGRSALLERERELGSLAALIREARGGSARVALIEGRAGIGKTQLVAEARRLAVEAGVRTLSARGGELEREFAFGVVRQLFEPPLREAGTRGRLLAGAADAARPIFEELSDDGESSGDTSFAVLHGLFWLTVNLTTDAPLMLAIDDLHWSDRPSLRFLAYLVRRLEGLPVLVVASLRPSEPGVDAALVGEITGDPLTSVLHPGPLSESAVDELVRRRLGQQAAPAFAAACHAATGGNPLLLNELLKALETEAVHPDASQVGVVAELGPRAASRAVLLRLARLSPDAVAAARALAILGDGADLVSVAGLARLAERDAAAATSALSRAEIIRAEPPLGFVHPLVAGAVYRDIPPGERELQHERAAHLLTRNGASVEHVAAHLLAIPARGERWAVDTLRSAAHAALQKGAPDSAASYLARALEEQPEADARTELLLELGRAELLTHGPPAAEHLQEAYEGLEDAEVRAGVAQMLGRALLFTGYPREGADVARRAIADLPPELTDLRAALEAFELVAVLFGEGEPKTLERLQPHRSVDRAAGPGAKMLAAMAAIDWVYRGGPADEIAALALDAWAGGDLLAADPGLLSLAVTNVLTLADREEADEIWNESFTEAHRHGSLFAISGIHMWHGFMQLRRGELAEAEDELEAAWNEFVLWGYGQVAHFYCSAFLATTLLERGRIAEARAALARAGDPDVLADGVRFWLNARLELLVAEGEAQEALATADRIARDYPHTENPAVGQWRSLKAQALDRLGRTDEALALAAEEVELARSFGAPWTLGRSLRVLGTLERDGGLGHLQEAVAVLEGSPARLECAKALAALGTRLRHLRQPTEAREPLRRALQLADACGAGGLAEQVRTELYAAGARPRTTALQGVEALTASERRVADLAAEGGTNRDIAQTLFVTPKTVEVHLSNVYRKLGIRSRRELAPALATS